MQPIQFSEMLSCAAGRVAELRLIKDCVRVTCVSPKQKSIMLHMTEWNGKMISVTEPRFKSSRAISDRASMSTRSVTGITYGVSTELTDAESEKVKQSDNFVFVITNYVSLPLTLIITVNPTPR